MAADKAATTKAQQNGTLGCLGILGVLFLVGMCSSNNSDKDTAANSVATAVPALTADQAKALEKDNKSRITAKLAEAKSVPSSDIEKNSAIYQDLVNLAPANTSFITKREYYKSLLEKSAAYSSRPEQALQLEKFSWEKGGFDNVQLVHFTVRNLAPFPIKDFTLTCNHQGPSGTDMDKNVRVVYEMVPAKGTKRVKEVNMGIIAGQVASSRCEITDAVHG